MSNKSLELFDIFHRAAEIESLTEQERFIKQSCEGHPEVFSRISALLEAHRSAGGFLGGADFSETTTAQFDTATLNTVIGPYQLIDVLGSGGMGIVYAAEQRGPLRRQVALKVIKPGMDSREVLARFGTERQALAIMDHPNIARVYDAGSTESGHPYFVMELVRGLRITDYCDRHRLSVSERLKLFITVCRAVEHAHQRGILHRDLKPSNVLIAQQDGGPVPKIIDFGVAKAITERITDHTVLTQQTQLLGTPLYMSPEQAELGGVELDVRSDVYSLGVLLYELLTGCTPIDKDRLANASFDELRRIIRQDKPPLPSQKFKTLAPELSRPIADARNTAERQLRQSLQGDLDWVVMKALAKDRTHRYESAAALAADLQRYLDRQPVSVGPPSPLSRVREIVRPTHVALMAIVILIAALVPLLGQFPSNTSAPEPQNSEHSSVQELSVPVTDQEQEIADLSTLNDAAAEAPQENEAETGPVEPVRPTPAAVEQDSAQLNPPKESTDVADNSSAPIPPLAVFPFEERGTGAKGYGSKISDFLLASLAVNPELIIVERAELNKALDEQKLTAAGLTNPDEAVQIGRLTGAKLIVLGSILELDSTLILSARITSTETSRIAGAKVRGKTTDDLAELADKLAEEVLATLSERADQLLPKPVSRTDRLAAIVKAIGDRPRPKVWLQVKEEHVGQATIDPAAETELANLMEDAGFTVIDHQSGNRKHADVIVEGEAFSEFAIRHQDLISVKARVEIKAVRTATGERIATDRQTEIAVDVAEQVAGKTALQNAAAEIASRLLPKLVISPAN
ncbi:MAG: protein kinase [Planctomycetaceae bacterium]|nr:protein kinase [Planctomycetaceae bacterium]